MKCPNILDFKSNQMVKYAQKLHLAIVVSIFQQNIMGEIKFEDRVKFSLSGSTPFSLTISCRQVVLTQNPTSSSPL